MRRLVIMRHAKAERGDGKLDYDRTLETRGWSEAETVGAELAGYGIRPDTVLCSAARRTRDTLAAMLPHIGGDCIVHLRKSLYDAEVADLRDAVRKAQGACVLLIGHNPSVHALAVQFAGAGAGDELMRGGFPTATAAVFTLGFAIDTVRFERVVAP